MKQIAYFLFLTIITACHTSKIANRTMDKKYHRNNFVFKTVQTKNHQLTYWDNESSKPTLVLIHGFGTWAKFNWHKQIKDLGAEYRVVTPNLLHFGKSNCVKCGYTIDDQVMALNELFQHLQLDHIYLTGASYGGVVAIEYTDAFPEKVEKLIIVDSPIKFFTEQQVEEVETHFGVTSIQNLLIPNDHKGLKTLTSIVYQKPPFTPTFLYKDVFENMFLPYKDEMTKTLSALLDNRNYFAERAYKIQIPILFIWGENDMLVPKRVGKSLYNYFDLNSELFIVEATAHMPILEKPKKCNARILSFLRSSNSSLIENDQLTD